MFTSNGLSVSSNDIQMKKRPLTNSNNKIVDANMNEYILDIIREQLKQMKQSFDKVFDNVKQKEQTSTNEIILNNDLSHDAKELQEQVSFTFSKTRNSVNPGESFRQSNPIG
jgi:hypothetical protein